MRLAVKLGGRLGAAQLSPESVECEYTPAADIASALLPVPLSSCAVKPGGVVGVFQLSP